MRRTTHSASIWHARSGMEPAQRTFTVRPAGEDDRWLLSEAGDEKPQQFPTRAEAVEAGKKLAQGHGPARLQVFDSQGAVESETTYEKDPLVTQLEKFGF